MTDLIGDSVFDDSKPWFLGNQNIRKDGVVQKWTKEEIGEYKRCSKDPKYFIENYVKILSLDRGMISFKMHDYQKALVDHCNDNRFTICLAARQSGKSITIVAYILWYVMFNSDKRIYLLANKGETAREMLSRFYLALENVPFFLQPGARILNRGSAEFSNNTHIVAASTSNSSIRGRSANLIALDEFAFVERDELFYTSTYPVISSGETSKVIITSTANGVGNVFHRIWEGAVQRTNEFKPIRVDWHQVPGRDERWKKQTIANTSERQFAQEFSNSFLSTGNTLISGDYLLGLKEREPESVTNDAVNVYYEPEEGHSYVMISDVSKGRGQDYTTFSVIDISVEPWQQVATFRDSMISPLLFPTLLDKVGRWFNDALIIVESNDTGTVVVNGLYYDIEYENTYVESSIKAGGVGLTMTKKIKRIGCSHLKDLIEMNRLIINDRDTVLELCTFVAKGDSFEAADGHHDDMVMPLVAFAWFSGTDEFAELSKNHMFIRDMLYRDRIAAMEADMLPIPIYVSNGDTVYGLSGEQVEYLEEDGWSIAS